MVLSRGHRAFLDTICALAAFALLTPCIAAEYVQNNISSTPGYKLLPGVASVPAPVSVAPDQDWVGIDGTWNTFSLFVGDPRVNVRVGVSTASQQIWTINHQACVRNVTDSSGKVIEVNKVNEECLLSRGYTYNQSASSTWHVKGYYRLWIEKWLGYQGNGLFGFDSVGLGFPGEQGPTVQNTTIGTLVSPNFWLGHIGLHHKPTNFSVFEDSIPSYMTNLFTQKSIPSLSFGYTAGSRYHGNIALASLTLGGYDASKIFRNDLTFILAPDNERDIVVGVVGLTANTTTKSNIDLLKDTDLNMYIDSTVAEMWLPVEICQAFEDAFGLKYDTKTNLYLVDDVLHETLMTQNPSVTFTLGQKYSTDATMQITLPYAAFDLEASPPYRGLKEKTRFFPIRQGANSSQWVLGRTFLQEAYLTVDWERANFSVSAIDWTFDKPQELTTIVSPQYAEYQPPKPPKKPLSSSAILGISLGTGFGVALILIAIGWYFWRRRHKQKLQEIKAKYEAEVAAAAAAKKATPDTSEETPSSPLQESETGTGIFPKAELPAESAAAHHEMSTAASEKDQTVINEADNTERQIFEMPGCSPERQEAGGRQLSEKESMVVRERIYNGVDPHSPTSSPTAQEPTQGFTPVSPSEVTMVNRRLPSTSTCNVSPITPRTPRDGAFLEANDTFFQLPPYRPRQEGRSPEDTLLSPISPLEGSPEASRRRFSYES